MFIPCERYFESMTKKCPLFDILMTINTSNQQPVLFLNTMLSAVEGVFRVWARRQFSASPPQCIQNHVYCPQN